MSRIALDVVSLESCFSISEAVRCGHTTAHMGGDLTARTVLVSTLPGRHILNDKNYPSLL